jgi:hypothetical protein
MFSFIRFMHGLSNKNFFYFKECFVIKKNNKYYIVIIRVSFIYFLNLRFKITY